MSIITLKMYFGRVDREVAKTRQIISESMDLTGIARVLIMW